MVNSQVENLAVTSGSDERNDPGDLHEYILRDILGLGGVPAAIAINQVHHLGCLYVGTNWAKASSVALLDFHHQGGIGIGLDWHRQ